MSAEHDPVKLLLAHVRMMRHDIEQMVTALDRLQRAGEETARRGEHRAIVRASRGPALVVLREAEREQIAAMYRNGMTMQALIEASGYSSTILRRELRAVGIKIRGRGQSNAARARRRVA